jgi:hypothetical protein
MIDVFWEEKEISDNERKESSEIYRAILNRPHTAKEAIEKAKDYINYMVEKGLIM